jgi:hypothetical protein
MPPTTKDVIKALQQQDVTVVRQSSSHIIMSNGAVLTANSKDVPPWILKKAGLKEVNGQLVPIDNGDNTAPAVGGNAGSDSGSSSTQNSGNSGKKQSNSQPATLGATPSPGSFTPVNNDLTQPKIKPVSTSDLIGGSINTASGPDLVHVGGGTPINVNHDLLGPQTGDTPAPDLQGPDPTRNEQSASSDLSQPVGPPPPPYTGGAPVVSATQNPDTGVTQTVTSTGAVIDQSADGTPYRAGWVDPNNPDSPILPGATNPYTSPPDTSTDPNAFQTVKNENDNAGTTNLAPDPNPTPPPPYTGGAPVSSVTQNPTTGVTQTITATGAVIDQAPGGTPYRAGWVDPNNPNSPILPGDTNPYTSSGSSAPDSSSTPTLGFSGSDVVPADPNTGFAYGDADPYASNPAPVAPAPVSDSSSAPAAPPDNSSQTDTSAPTLAFSGPDVVPTDPNTGFAYGDADPYASAPAAPPPSDPTPAPMPAADPPPPDPAPDDGGGIALPASNDNTSPIVNSGGMVVDPNTGNTYGDWQP